VTKLRELRLLRKLSLIDLCRARGLNVSAVSQAERRKAAPSAKTRHELARFYREPQEELFDRDGLAL
jgi:transcriptional regulator with XRE-family HTH domain